MNPVKSCIVLLTFLVTASAISAQVPGIINYQGRVSVGGTNFNGTGSFKFALVNNTGTTRFWSNGVNTVSITVTKGLYSVLLGDTGIPTMTTPIPYTVFSNTDVRLRVWFNDGVSGLQQLSPDQRIAAAGYALTVPNVRAVGNNTFVGENAGNLTMSGSYNTATGWNTLQANTTGYDNTAVGTYALFLNTTGHDNTVVGYDALMDNTSGSGNTAIGAGALMQNTNGVQNTAVGETALNSNTSGYGNTGNGESALAFNTTGVRNTACGQVALMQNTSGSNNIAVGYAAGYYLTTGNDNIDIGNRGVAGEGGIIRVGTVGTQTNTYIAGIYGTTASGGLTVYVNNDGKLGTVTSSRRFKEAIHDMADKSDVLLSLHPVSFRYKDEIDPQGIPQFGLVAEEVEQVAPELVVRDANGAAYSVRYEQVNAMLLNEFLKEHRQMQELKQELQELKAQVAEIRGGQQ